ncbi:MAG TPA: hypothetical protein VGD98_04725 [Ktedonobacteraceae bacterium]
MAIEATPATQLAQAPARPLLDGARFDLIFGFTATWYVGGTYLDAWAHNNIPSLETFWTPWHGILYSGAFATFCVLLGTILLNRRRGATSWLEAIPTGYKPAVLGACGLLIGGVGDALWHTFFGIEQNIDALFSPTHLFLMIASALLAIGPLRAMYYRKSEPVTLGDHLGLAYALALFYAMIMVILQAVHPFTLFKLPLTAANSNTQGTEQLFAILGFVVQMSFFAGCALYVMRRWTLRFGFFTVVLTLASLGLAQMHYFQLAIPISLLAGLVIDMAYLLLKPTQTSPLSVRLFAAIAAMALPAFYLLALRLFDGPLVWTIHMLVGSVLVCGIFAWLLSYLVIPGAQE